MIGSGTKDLAQGLVELAAIFAEGRGRPALRVYDTRGRLLASAGLLQADGEVACACDAEEASLEGLADGRFAELRPVCLRDKVELWVVATDDVGVDAAHLRQAVGVAARVLESERLRDYESEDTTEHLLTCFEQIRAVHDLSDKLPSCESVEAMGQLCLESLNTALGVRQSALVLLESDREGERRSGRVYRIGHGRSWTHEYASIEGPLADAIDDGKVRYASIDNYEIAVGSLEAEAQSALMVVPISFGSAGSDSVLGALVLLDREDEGPGRAFGSPDADLAQSVSTLLGLAIGTRARAEAEKELQIARAIQETLIPASAPDWRSLDVAGRNRSANQVGGDYFDYIESVDGREHCLIADVSGHNMASAMAMVMARSKLQTIASIENSPSAIFSSLAQGLYQDLVRNELFITAFFLSIVERDDEGCVRFRYSNAGHNPPLLLRADGDVEWLDGGGPMIGFLPAVDYDECEVWMRPGDLLVLYTDGVTEATDAKGEMLDEAGLARVVSELKGEASLTILEGIYRSVDEHSEHRPADDDVTVVVLKCPLREGEPLQTAGTASGREE